MICSSYLLILAALLFGFVGIGIIVFVGLQLLLKVRVVIASAILVVGIVIVVGFACMCTRGIVQVTYSPLFVEGEVRGSSPGDKVLSMMCGSSIGRDGWLAVQWV